MRLIHGDCLEELKKLPENSIDAVVTDPPYGLSFMGKKWDYDVPSVEIWQECLRVLKPGGYLLSFAGTRTYHRMATGIEDAGFEIRDMIAWVYGSGFPKSLNIGKAIDKMQGNEREVLPPKQFADGTRQRATARAGIYSEQKGQAKNTKGTSEWEGWGTALKPALEPITIARKPIEGTVAENCLKWGVGGINIDECRVGTEERETWSCGSQNYKVSNAEPWRETKHNITGRFPANLIHDGSDEVVELFPNTKSKGHAPKLGKGNPFGGDNETPREEYYHNDSGSAARFFYVAKASKSERNMGCEGLEEKQYTMSSTPKRQVVDGVQQSVDFVTKPLTNKNNHPTVKPIALMEYLIKLVSREGATVLDPFMGSGTTGIACKKLKRHFIGIEREAEYIKIAESRIAAQPITLL